MLSRESVTDILTRMPDVTLQTQYRRLSGAEEVPLFVAYHLQDRTSTTLLFFSHQRPLLLLPLNSRGPEHLRDLVRLSESERESEHPKQKKEIPKSIGETHNAGGA